MSDIRIQTLEVIIPAGDSETDAFIPLQINPSRTRVIMASPGLQMQIVDSALPSVNTRDMQIGVEIIDLHTVRIHSSPNAQSDGLATFSLMEYVGKENGPNAFSVARKEVYNPVGSNGVDLGVLQFEAEDPTKGTTHIVGCVLEDSSGSDSAGNFHSATLYYPMLRYVTDFDTIEFEQLWVGLNDHGVRLWIENVNWYGSNWTVVRAPFGQGTASRSDTITFTTAGGAGKTVELSQSLDWSETWIEATRGCDLFTDPVNGEVRANIVPDLPSGTDVIARTPSTGDATNAPTNGAAFYAISSPEIKVSHQGDELGTGDAAIATSSVDGPRTFRIEVDNTTATISGEADRVISLLNGSADFLSAASGAGAHFHSEGNISVRRVYTPFESWSEYIQTVQFGLEDSTSGSIEDQMLRNPKWIVEIRNR